MYLNRILKVLCSLPVIIIVGFFSPFVGFCLIIARRFVFYRTRYSTSVCLIIVGVVMSIPAISVVIFKLANAANIQLFETVVNWELYPRILDYAKFLVCVGIVFLLQLLLFRRVLGRISYHISSFISRKEEIYKEVAKENDMEIKLQQEKAKNTCVVYCLVGQTAYLPKQ